MPRLENGDYQCNYCCAVANRKLYVYRLGKKFKCEKCMDNPLPAEWNNGKPIHAGFYYVACQPKSEGMLCKNLTYCMLQLSSVEARRKFRYGKIVGFVKIPQHFVAGQNGAI